MEQKSTSFFTGMSGWTCQKDRSCTKKAGIRSASDLLKILFLYACSNISFRILAAAAYALGISDISDFTWKGRCDSLTGCQPSRFSGIGGCKAGKPHQSETPCQPTEISQNLFYAIPVKSRFSGDSHSRLCTKILNYPHLCLTLCF